jgi:hypothetical protein
LPRPKDFKSLDDAQKYNEDLLGALERWQVETTDKDKTLEDLIVRPEWYGAKGDGVHDDTTAIQAAINASLGVGIPLKFGPKKYKFTNLTLPENAGLFNYVILGSGCPDLLADGEEDFARVGGTVLYSTIADGSHAISFTPVGADACYASVTIRDLEIMGPDTETPATTTSGNGINFVGDKASGVTIKVNLENISVNHFFGGSGIYLNYCENGGGRNVTVNRNKYGLYLKNATNANTWVNVVAQYNSTNAIYIGGTAADDACCTNVFLGGLIQANPKNGVFISGGEQIVFCGTHFESNNSDSPNNYYTVHIKGGAGLSSSRITFDTVRFGGANDSVYLEGVAGPIYYTHFNNCRSYASGNALTLADGWVGYTKITGAFSGTVSDSGTGTYIGDPDQYLNTTDGPTFNHLHLGSYALIPDVDHLTTTFNVLCKNIANGIFYISGGSAYNLGGRITMFGESHATYPNQLFIDGVPTFRSGADNDGVYKVAGTQVVGAQQATIVNADAGSIVAQFNTLLAELRTHGIIDT